MSKDETSKAPAKARAELAAGAKVTAADHAAAQKRMDDSWNKPHPHQRSKSGPQNQGGK